MADDHKPLPGAHLGGNHHPTGIMPSNNVWHTSENGLGRALKNSNHLSHENQIPEVRNTFLWRRETGFFTQRGRHQLHLVKVSHRTIHGQSVSRNNYDHGNMEKQHLPAVYPYPGQWSHQGHQCPHDKQAIFLHNTRNRIFLPHTRTRRHRTTNSEYTQTRKITYNFLPLTNALKWSPRK